MPTKEIEVKFREGDRVRHVMYGAGTVISYSINSSVVYITVDFDRCGKRELAYLIFVDRLDAE